MDDDRTIRLSNSDDAEGALAPGARVFNRFTLEKVIGKGGMGVVWRAQDEMLGETVALKFLPDVVSGDPKAIDELKDETRKARRLTHPSIVRIHDFIQDEARAALSMECVDGTTLMKLQLAQPGKIFSVEKLAPLLTQLCAALDYAHRTAKIAHRDLKPANILVTHDGIVKVTDFGIARSLTESSTRLTGKGGNISGTIPYMSPQQLMGKKPTSSDDIYALGATIYELLTSKPPFFRGEAYSLMKQISELPPQPLEEKRAELEISGEAIPKEWEETILACLAKEPEGRPASAEEVAARLNLGGTREWKRPTEAKAAALPEQPKPAKAKSDFAEIFRLHRNRILAGALAVVVLGGGAAWFWASYLPSERRTADSKPMQEQKEYNVIAARIEALFDSSSSAQVANLEQAVKEYIMNAPERYTQVVTAAWAKRKAGWEAAREAAAAAAAKAKAEKEQKEHAAVVAVIEAAVDGITQAQLDTAESSVKAYLESAPERLKSEVALAWAKRKSGWETAKIAEEKRRADLEAERKRRELAAGAALAKAELEHKENLAILARIETITDASSRPQVDVAEVAVQSYLSTAPDSFKAGVTAAWKKRKDAWEAAQRKRAEEAARAKAAQEDKEQVAIVAQIEALADAAPRPQLDTVGKAVEAYLGNAPERHKESVTAAWAKRRAAWEQKEATTLTERIEALPDGAPRTQLDAIGQAVQDYVKTAPERFKAGVTESWAKRKAGWESAKEQKDFDALAARIEATADGSPRTQLDATNQAVQTYLKSAPERFKAGATASWEKRKAGWETARRAAVRVTATIRSEPAGALVTVEGHPPGPSPLTLKDLKLGKHAVIVKRDGYEDWSGEFEAKEGEPAGLSAKLTRSTGTLIVKSEPPGLDWIARSSDGIVARGKTPDSKAIPVGRYVVTVSRTDWPSPHEQTIEIERNKESGATADFSPGQIKITSKPEKAAVVKAGKILGYTPWHSMEALPGKHEYELRLDGYNSKIVSGTVTKKQELLLEATLERKPYPLANQTWENTLGMKFAPVPGTPALFSIWEVRVQDFAAYAHGTGRNIPAPAFRQTQSHPVVNVSWTDAQGFCQWLTEREKKADRLSANQRYRLPTDAEWSLAAGLTNEGGGTPADKDSKVKGTYPWGTQWPPPQGAGNFADESAARTRPGSRMISGYNDGNVDTSPVGTFAANRLGLFDLSGNTWEWCSDEYRIGGGTRVLRGGSFVSHAPETLLSSLRISYPADYRNEFIGFRCVLEVGP